MKLWKKFHYQIFHTLKSFMMVAVVTGNGFCPGDENIQLFCAGEFFFFTLMWTGWIFHTIKNVPAFLLSLHCGRWLGTSCLLFNLFLVFLYSFLKLYIVHWKGMYMYIYLLCFFYIYIYASGLLPIFMCNII